MKYLNKEIFKSSFFDKIAKYISIVTIMLLGITAVLEIKNIENTGVVKVLFVISMTLVGISLLSNVAEAVLEERNNKLFITTYVVCGLVLIAILLSAV